MFSVLGLAFTCSVLKVEMWLIAADDSELEWGENVDLRGVLASFMPTQHKRDSLGKRDPQLKKCHIRSACRQACSAFS